MSLTRRRSRWDLVGRPMDDLKEGTRAWNMIMFQRRYKPKLLFYYSAWSNLEIELCLFIIGPQMDIDFTSVGCVVRRRLQFQLCVCVWVRGDGETKKYDSRVFRASLRGWVFSLGWSNCIKPPQNFVVGLRYNPDKQYGWETDGIRLNSCVVILTRQYVT